jgi:hypothetical protein
MLVLKLFLITLFLASIVWVLVAPDYKAITAVVITAGSLLAIRVNERAQKDKREFEPK